MRLDGVRTLSIRCAALALLVFALIVTQWTLVARIVNGVFQSGMPPATLLGPFMLLGLVWLARSVLLGLRDFLASRAAIRLKRLVRERLYARFLDLGPAFVAGERSGELTETFMGGVEKLDAFVARFVPGAVFALVIPPLLALTVLTLDVMSGLILLFTGPLIVLLLWLVGMLADKAAREQWLVLGRLGAGFVDTLRGLPTLVVFGRAQARLRELNTLNDAYRRTTMRVLRTAFLSGAVLELGATLATALVAVTVGVRLFEGHLPFERAFLVLLLTPEFFAPLRALGAEHHASLEARAASERLFGVLHAPVPERKTGSVPSAPLHVELRNVTLTYGERPALEGVSLELPPGSSTALVGPSGAGKSSVARLLLAFMQPSSGEVLVNGASLTSLDPLLWRSLVAYVPERPYLFPGTVRENLTLGLPRVTDAQVTDAARAAGAHEFITRLPLGYDTLLAEDGVNLSGGQRVRLAIARAFLKDAPLLILDEPTAQLDAASERDVQDALRRLSEGRTVLTITHRAALVRDHTRVLQLQDGRLVTPHEPAPSAQTTGVA